MTSPTTASLWKYFVPSLCISVALIALFYQPIEAQRSSQSSARSASTSRSSSSGRIARSTGTSSRSSTPSSRNSKNASRSYSGRIARSTSSSSSTRSSHSSGSYSGRRERSSGTNSTPTSRSGSKVYIPGSSSPPTNRSSYTSAPRTPSYRSLPTSGSSHTRSSSANPSPSRASYTSNPRETAGQSGRSQRALDPLARKGAQPSRSERAGIPTRHSYTSTSNGHTRSEGALAQEASSNDKAPQLSLRGQRSSYTSEPYTSHNSALTTLHSNDTKQGYSVAYTLSSPDCSYGYYNSGTFPYAYHINPYASIYYPQAHGAFYYGTNYFYGSSYAAHYLHSSYAAGCKASLGISYLFPIATHQGFTIGIQLGVGSCQSRHGSLYASYTPCNTNVSLYYTRSNGSGSYRTYRPYYYDAPSWYGWRYDARHGYACDIVEYRSTDATYDKSYDDGYANATVTSYRKRTQRHIFTTNVEPESRPFKSNFEDIEERGTEAFHAGNYELAIELFKDSVVARPLDGIAKLNLGHAAFAAGRYELAAFSLRRGLALKPASIENRDKLNPRDRYADSAIYEHQLERLLNAAEKDENNHDLHFLVAYHHFFEGEVEQAIEALERLLALAPNDEAAKQLFAGAMNQLVTDKE